LHYNFDSFYLKEGVVVGKGIRYLESPATDEENSYNYRVEWEDHYEMIYDSSNPAGSVVHNGPGSYMYYNDYDNAWDKYCELSDNPHFRRVHLIRISPDGSEKEWA